MYQARTAEVPRNGSGRVVGYAENPSKDVTVGEHSRAISLTSTA